MKNFVTSMLGALMALMIFSAACLLLFIGVLAAMAAMGRTEGVPEFQRGSYLVFDLGTNISDSPTTIDLSLFRARTDSIQLRTITRALRSAAGDDRIAGVFITGDLSRAAFTTGFAALREVREALETVKQAGKPIMAYVTYATTRSYYLASAATDLAIDPYGVILMPGLATEPVFFAGALEKYGVNVQVTRVGKYKSAVEPFTREDMSPESREEMQRLLDDLWNGLLNQVAPNRQLTPEKFQAIVDTEGVIRADAALARNFVDRVAYRDEIYDELKAKTGRAGSKEPFKQIRISDYARVLRDVADPMRPDGELPKRAKGRARIAIVYADGDIVDGEGETGSVGSTRFSRALRKLRQDEDVKAVVLRVNSPGGSASASEVIQREVRLMRNVKPMVVSMGSYAASGGYWIAAYADRIFAEASTITGSIGVFGLQFDIQQLANNFGVTFDSVKTGKFADSLTIARPKTEEELDVLQRQVDWVYDQFIAKVADARKLERAAVEDIAQGRVWTGSEAKELGLVDEIGGLDAAIAYAAQKAGIRTGFRLIEYPRQKDLFELLQELIGRGPPSLTGTRSLPAMVAERLESELKVLRSFNDPQGIYARLPITLLIR
jgi:protease IV